MALVFGLRAILFRGTVIAEYILQIGSLQLPGATMKCVLLGLISALGVYSFAKSLLGTALMKRFYPENKKARAYYAKENETPRTGAQVAEAVVGLVVMVLLSVYAATDNFGVGADYVRYCPDDALFQVVQVENRDLQVYKVAGTLDDDNGQFEAVDNGYAITDGRGHPYYVGDLTPGGDMEQKLLSIAEENGHPVKAVKTVEDIKS